MITANGKCRNERSQKVRTLERIKTKQKGVMGVKTFKKLWGIGLVFLLAISAVGCGEQHPSAEASSANIENEQGVVSSGILLIPGEPEAVLFAPSCDGIEARGFQDYRIDWDGGSASGLLGPYALEFKAPPGSEIEIVITGSGRKADTDGRLILFGTATIPVGGGFIITTLTCSFTPNKVNVGIELPPVGTCLSGICGSAPTPTPIAPGGCALPIRSSSGVISRLETNLFCATDPSVCDDFWFSSVGRTIPSEVYVVPGTGPFYLNAVIDGSWATEANIPVEIGSIRTSAKVSNGVGGYNYIVNIPLNACAWEDDLSGLNQPSEDPCDAECGGIIDPVRTVSYLGVLFGDEQCVPAARNFYEALYPDSKLPYLGTNGSAKWFWNDPNYWPIGFDRIANLDSNQPRPHDAIIWVTGVHGHIAVVIEVIDWSRKLVKVVDSNWGSDLQGQIHDVVITASVGGWYRPKPSVIPSPTPIDSDHDGFPDGSDCAPYDPTRAADCSLPPPLLPAPVWTVTPMYDGPTMSTYMQWRAVAGATRYAWYFGTSMPDTVNYSARVETSSTEYLHRVAHGPYCYKVAAIDVSGKEGALSTGQCVTVP